MDNDDDRQSSDDQALDLRESGTKSRQSSSDRGQWAPDRSMMILAI
jgi:hypothetical protein